MSALRQRREAGFTLIEVLIATALLATMGGIIFSAFQLTLSAQDRTRLTRDRLHAARVSVSLMAREISMAYLSTHVDEEERRQTFFDGRKDEIDFTSLSHRRLLAGAPESDQAELGYSIGTDRRYPGEKVLLRRSKVPLDDKPGKGGDEEVIATGVRELEMAYWDARREQWTDDWQVDFEDVIQPSINAKSRAAEHEGGSESLTLLPFRVKVRLTVADADGKDLTVETQTPLMMRRAFRFNMLAGGQNKRTTRPGVVQPKPPGVR